MVVVYLHGFASSPQSSKATFFAERFAAEGIGFLCPDLNRPAFSRSPSRGCCSSSRIRSRRSRPTDIVLIGSSLGGFVAVEAAARHAGRARHPISRLILLAPAVELEWDRWSEIGPRRRRTLAAGPATSKSFTMRWIGPNGSDSASIEDAEQYHPASRQLALPMLIFQGRQDESVSPDIVERFAQHQPAATLHMLDDTHQLKNSLDFIWRETERFLYETGG